MTDAVIVSTARTPIGKAYRGALNATEGATLSRTRDRQRRSFASRPRPEGSGRRGDGRARCSKARPAATSRARRCCARACRSPSPAPPSTGNALPACRPLRSLRAR